MPSLSKLILTKFERSQTHRNPILERCAKALTALAQQRDVLTAALEGKEFTVKISKWAIDEHGRHYRVEKDRLVRPWFFKETQGWLVQLKYGARVVPLDTDHNAVVVPELSDVCAVFDIFEKAVQSCDFDKSLAALAELKTRSTEGVHA